MTDQSDWVQRLDESGIDVFEQPDVAAAAAEAGKDYQACIMARPRPEGYEFEVHLLPGLPRGEQSELCHEAMKRFDRMSEFGPEPDGWQLRSDGDYQLWLRLHFFGEWLTEHE